MAEAKLVFWESEIRRTAVKLRKKLSKNQVKSKFENRKNQ